jgi:hypothetical protein
MIGVDQFGLVGMLSFEQAGAFGEAAARVLSSVPLDPVAGRPVCRHQVLPMAIDRRVVRQQRENTRSM